MKIYSQVQAFNESYKVGDLLLIRDPFGETFDDTLTAPAKVLGEEAYIELEFHRYMININKVLSKVNQSVHQSRMEPISAHRQSLAAQIWQKAQSTKAKIESYQETIDCYQQLKQQAKTFLTNEQHRQARVAYYSSRIALYEQYVTINHHFYEQALDRLKRLRVHIEVM